MEIYRCNELSENLIKLNSSMEEIVKEKTKFEETIIELINLVKLYKKKECDMQQKEAAFAEKVTSFQINNFQNLIML